MKKNDVQIVDNVLNEKETININIKSEYEKEKCSVYLCIKRIFDIFGSLLGLIVLSPVFLIIAICIKLNDGGNVFYKHKRIGQFGKPIYLYKFRSMKMNADDLETSLTQEQLEIYKSEFKIENDPRVTRVGDFLRKTSLDELPQLFNILIGNMSIVGPRPIVEDELVNYGQEANKFLSVKPGLTGYWQAYVRNDADYASGTRQSMELYYIDNRSFVFDIKIIFKTVTAVLKKTGK